MLEPGTKITETIQEKTLDVVSYAIGQTIYKRTAALFSQPPEVVHYELAEKMADQFIARFRLPSEVLQDQKVIAEYPKRGILNAIRYELAMLGNRYPRALGWLQKAMPTINRVRVYEAAVYPNIPVHPDMDYVRIFFSSNTEVVSDNG